MTTLQARWSEAEAVAEARRRTKARRQPLILLALLNVLVLGIGVTASVDLRRLNTPGGTSLRWVQSAVFGNCEDYLAYSVPDASVTDARPRSQLCRDLRAATATARADSSTIGLRLGGVVRSGNRAEVEITLLRSGTPTVVSLRTTRLGGHWRVVRDRVTCTVVGCP